MKHSTIFRSRWMALIWAAGFIWLAIDVADSAKQSEAGNNVAAADDNSAGDVTAKDVKAFNDAVQGL